MRPPLGVRLKAAVDRLRKKGQRHHDDKTETEWDFTDTAFGPMSHIPGFPEAGPIFLSSEGHEAWMAAGRPKIVPPLTKPIQS